MRSVCIILQSDIVPADGIGAAAQEKDFGTSCWQL
jgi:hypothetical protein